jgi:hypothetical protein
LARQKQLEIAQKAEEERQKNAAVELVKKKQEAE